MSGEVTRAFPDGFLLGTATAAHQVEGGNDNSDWWQWEQEPGHIKNDDKSGRAVDHYNRYREDIAQLAADGHTLYRFSVEWARVESRPGSYDDAALEHYKDVVSVCREHDIEPIVTLHHFTLPQWLGAQGGVKAPGIVERFEAYSRICAEGFGDQVTYWITLNEPGVLARLAYGWGIWPPGTGGGNRGYFEALAVMLKMHGAGATAVRDVAKAQGRRALISIAHNDSHIRVTGVQEGIAQTLAPIRNYIDNRLFLDACVKERALYPLGDGEPVEGTALDYLGLNFYWERNGKVDIELPDEYFFEEIHDPDVLRSTFGSPIVPDALRGALLDLSADFPGLPIIITENGVADNDDALRPKFIVDHLDAVLDAIEQGADVRGYASWSAWDNFEWAEGYAQKFGLYTVDRQTLERVPKPSAKVFSAICKDHAITDAMRRLVLRGGGPEVPVPAS